MSTYLISQYILSFLIDLENKKLFRNFRLKLSLYKGGITGMLPSLAVGSAGERGGGGGYVQVVDENLFSKLL